MLAEAPTLGGTWPATSGLPKSTHSSVRTFLRYVAVVSGLLAGVLTSALAACASLPRIPCTEGEAERAEIAGMARSRAILARRAGPVEYLARSGGGGDGAFGAGLLNGWSESG